MDTDLTRKGGEYYTFCQAEDEPHSSFVHLIKLLYEIASSPENEFFFQIFHINC